VQSIDTDEIRRMTVSCKSERTVVSWLFSLYVVGVMLSWSKPCGSDFQGYHLE
jgi:hypothetical protein